MLPLAAIDYPPISTWGFFLETFLLDAVVHVDVFVEFTCTLLRTWPAHTAPCHASETHIVVSMLSSLTQRVSKRRSNAIPLSQLGLV